MLSMQHKWLCEEKCGAVFVKQTQIYGPVLGHHPNMGDAGFVNCPA